NSSTSIGSSKNPLIEITLSPGLVTIYRYPFSIKYFGVLEAYLFPFWELTALIDTLSILILFSIVLTHSISSPEVLDIGLGILYLLLSMSHPTGGKQGQSWGGT